MDRIQLQRNSLEHSERQPESFQNPHTWPESRNCRNVWRSKYTDWLTSRLMQLRPPTCEDIMFSASFWPGSVIGCVGNRGALDRLQSNLLPTSALAFSTAGERAELAVPEWGENISKYEIHQVQNEERWARSNPSVWSFQTRVLAWGAALLGG